MTNTKKKEKEKEGWILKKELLGFQRGEINI